MAKQILPYGATWPAEHSLKDPFTGKSRTVTPSNVVRLRASGEGTLNIVNRKVAPPRRTPNNEKRSREYLTQKEVGALMDAARKMGRHRHRDATLILLAYRHALRVAELVALRCPYQPLCFRHTSR